MTQKREPLLNSTQANTGVLRLGDDLIKHEEPGHHGHSRGH